MGGKEAKCTITTKCRRNEAIFFGSCFCLIIRNLSRTSEYVVYCYVETAGIVLDYVQVILLSLVISTSTWNQKVGGV